MSTRKGAAPTGARYFPKSEEFFDTENFLPGYSFNELALLEVFTHLAWKRQSWVVLATIGYLERALAGRGVGSGAIKRHKKRFLKDGHLYLYKPDYDGGFQYLVTPRMLWAPLRANFKHWEEARLLLEGKVDHFDPPFPGEDWLDPNDPPPGSFRSTIEPFPCVDQDQNDPQIYTFKTLLKGANAGSQRCPTGQDQGSLNKGVLPDKIREGIELFKTGFHPDGRPIQFVGLGEGVRLPADTIRK